jgi:hypothetical protein
VIRNGGDEAINLFIVEQVLIPPRHRQTRGICDLTRQRVPSIVEIAGGDTLNSWQCNGMTHEARALHSDPDHAEAYAIAWRDGLRHGKHRPGIEEDSFGSKTGSGSGCAKTKKIPARKAGCHV